MNKLGQHVFHAFAAGSVEELAAALEVITLISIHPKTRRADQDFPRQVGSASQHSWGDGCLPAIVIANYQLSGTRPE
jgi:hypothetical protein